ncbi:hypothetical protein FQA39_LY12947 [Lamprigera yunnana]|nr:hypothetical protein FQA39_LY12947 [Lamprigera yunnana]
MVALYLQDGFKLKQASQIVADLKINPNEKYVKIYNNSLNQAIKHLRLEKTVTKECAKQVEAATAEYKIEIAELKLIQHDSQIKAQASDARIQQLENEIREIKSKIA